MRRGYTAGVARRRQTRDAAARAAGKLEREGLARGESEAKALAVAGRGAGERSEAGRGDCARSATFSERASRHRASQHNARAGWRTFRALARRAAPREASRGSCLAAVAGSGGRALASNRLAMSGATKASGGGQALSGDVAGRGQARDERGS